ncbi:MAG: hypothetical protein JWO87_3984, partial [Phycisphaerales bacterium]|nr:hypothetical protein [Phycisphaerales bacterium]
MAVRTPPVAPTASATPALVPHGSHAGKPSMPMGRPFTLVGSRQRAHLHLLSQSISKCHAIIVNNGGTLYVRDLASREHVIINGKPVREADLKDGDLVRFGSFTFRFVDGVGKGRSAPVRRPPEAALEMSGSSMPLMFDGRVIVIGRRPGCDVVLEEPSVSTIHAAIFELDGRHYIRDLGSRTGTLVNGEPIHHQPLEINDYIRVGDTEMRYIPGNVLGNLDELEHLIGTASLGTETAELASDDAARAAATPAAVEPDPDTIPIAASDSEDAPIPLAIDDDAIPLAEETPAARAALAASAGPAPAVAVPDLAEIDLDSDPDVSGSGDTAAIPLEPVNDTARTPVLSSRVVDSPDDLLDDEPPTPQAIPAAAAPEPDFGLDFLDEQFLPADPAGETIRVETAHAPSDDLGLEPLPVELDESTPQVTTEPPPLAMTAHAASLPAEPEEAIEESAAPTEHAPTDYEALVAAEPTEIAGPSESAVASESIIEDALPGIAEPLESVVASEAIIEDASLEPEVAADETPTDSAGHIAEPAEAELHFTAPPDVSGEQDPAAVTTADQTPIEDAPASPPLQAATESPDDFDFLTAFAESPTAESPAPVEEPAASVAMEAADVPVHDGPATEQAAPFEEAQSGVDFADEFAAEELAPPTVPLMPVAPPPIPVAPPAIVAEATPSPAKSADTRGKGKTKAKAKKGGISRFFGRRKKGELEAAEEIAPAAQADLASDAPVDASADPDSFRLEELAPGELTPLRKTHEAPEAHGPAPESEADAPEREATLTAHDAALADIAPLLADEHTQFTDTPAPGPHDTAAIARGVSDKPSPEVVAPTDPTPESALDLDWYINDPVAEPTLDVVGDGATASPADPLSDTSFDQAVQDFSGSALGALVEQAAEQPSAADEVAPAEAANSASVEDTIAQPPLIGDEVAEQQTATDVAATFNPAVLPETPAEDAVGGILDDERFGAGSHLGGPPEPTGDPIMDSAAAFLEHEDQAAEPENEADQILPPVESDAAAHERTEFSAEPLPATGAQPLPLPTDSAPFAMEPADAAPASEPAPATAPEPALADEHAVGEETVGEFDFAFTAPEEPLPIDFGASTEPATISEAHDEIGFAFPMTDDAASGANEAIAEPPEHAPADEALPVIDEQPAPADAPDRSATPDSPEPAALDEIPPATGEDSQSETLAEAPEPETPSVAASPKIDPMFGMTRDFGSFLGGLPLSLPPVRKPAPMFGDIPVSPAAEASALQPAARSAEPAIEPSESDDVSESAETAAPIEAPRSGHDIAAEDFGASDAALETTEPSTEFEPQPELDAFAEEPPELFDSAPDKLDTLPDSLEEITDLTQAVGEPAPTAPSADVSAPVEASALSPAAPMFEAPASPAPAAPTTAPASNTRTSLVPAGKTRRALAMTPPPRPKLPRASSVKPGEPVAPEPLAKSPVAQPGVIAMPPVFEVDVFSDMPVGFVAPPIPPIGDFLPQSSPAPRRRKTRVEEP